MFINILTKGGGFRGCTIYKITKKKNCVIKKKKKKSLFKLNNLFII